MAAIQRLEQDISIAEVARALEVNPNLLHRIALERPCYGRPRITAALRRQGWTVNPKRVYRLMREDNLLCVRKRRLRVIHEKR